MSTSRFAVGMSCAVFALTLVSSAFGRTVSVNVVTGGSGEPTGFDLEFGTPTAAEIDTLYIAYGPTDAGETTNGWAHVARVNCISADGTGGDLVVNDATDSCFVPLPEDFSADDYARFFLFSGETGVPGLSTRCPSTKTSPAMIVVLARSRLGVSPMSNVS